MKTSLPEEKSTSVDLNAVDALPGLITISHHTPPVAIGPPSKLRRVIVSACVPSQGPRDAGIRKRAEDFSRVLREEIP